MILVDVSALPTRTKKSKYSSVIAAQLFAQGVVFRARRLGLLPAPATLPCADCGEPADGYDHRDYGKPREVEPVCRSCNTRRGPARPG